MLIFNLLYCAINFTKTFLKEFFYIFCMEEKDPEKTGESHETHHSSHETHHSSGKPLTETLRKNPWILSTVILGVFAVLLVIGSFGSIATANAISEGDAAQIILDFAKDQTGQEVELDSVSETSGIYEITIIFQDQPVPLYLTKDGLNLVQGMTLLSTIPSGSQEQTSTEAPSQFSEEDKTKILEFSECLADNGVKAYGAGWCGYCKKLKETFGGVAQIEPFYLECQNADRTPTEHADTCDEEEISGFPTIKLNGESSGLSALSSFEDFADATGCSLPQLN